MKEETSLYTIMEALPSLNDDCLAFIVSAIESIISIREFYTVDTGELPEGAYNAIVELTQAVQLCKEKGPQIRGPSILA